ncbi:MAG TPA: tRNA pseudouridine(38-40) synthase TruA [Thermoanaerobaculia bacterium]|nr:tRNA pseudouridine(38-40) synthase TruA [Thermoanaerobaculia bacterium]
MRRALLTLQYIGTRYAGWQTQKNAISVQQVVESKLSSLCGQEVRVEGAGRTDSGVHAHGQRAHVDIPIDIDARGLILSLNDRLPEDIRLRDVTWVDDSFHCRFVPSLKTYVYRIWNDIAADVFLAPTHTHIRQELDATLMQQSAEAVAGRHDFRCYTVKDPEVASTIRTVHSLEILATGRTISITITADGFLRFMVRRIAGSLIEVGRRKQPPSIVSDALEPRFGPARWTAPAHGLTLQEVRYLE